MSEEYPLTPLVSKYLKGELRFVYCAGGWFAFREKTGWVACRLEEPEADVTRFLLREINVVSRDMVADFMLYLRSLLWVEGDAALGVFLKPEGDRLKVSDAAGWISTRSHMVNVLTGETRLADSGLFALGCVPCAFDPKATCPQWERFVSEVCPDDGEGLQKMFGLSLTFDRRFNVFFVAYGEAGTGKSTALAVLAALNTGTVCGVSLGAFGERFQTFPLTIHRLNLVQDMDSVFEGAGSVSLRESVLKSLTCGEKIQVEQKHVSPEYRRLTALSVFGCNKFPGFSDRSGAISHRLRLLRFPNVFRGARAEKLNLAETLIREELPGILNWSMSGYRSLVSEGGRVFPENATAAAMKADFIKSTRPEELFFDECLESGSVTKLQEPTRNVYFHYDNWCRFRNYRPLAENTFSRRLLEYFPTVEKIRAVVGGSRVKVYLGIRVLPCIDSLVGLP
ncbi:MAG: DUF5906 domain-containing protein [Planctomycetia bacterium]|nr:DUF5906 domain-containing protein [Planctomycetia bacterium]